MNAALLDELRSLVGARHVLVSAPEKAPFETDYTGRFSGRALAVALPGNAAETAGVVGACAAAGVAIVPQGGNTGLVGGAVPPAGAIVVSTRRLRDLGPVDQTSHMLVAGAGVTLAELDAHVAPHGLAFPVDHAARSQATVGGTVATNAGGALSWRHGTARSHIAGVEAVLPDGTTVSRLAGLVKDNTGYDLAQLLAGSEGTLAVITRAALRLQPRRDRHATVLLGLASLTQAVKAFEHVRARAPHLAAAEFFLRDGLELVCAHAGLPDPLEEPTDVYALIECSALADPLPEILEALADLHPAASAMASSEEERGRLWEYRERHNEAINAAGIPRKLDVAVPPSRLPQYCSSLARLVRRHAPGARFFLFGHLGDGNVHVNLLDLPPGERTEEEVLRLTLAHGGTIAAEHGIGRAKTRWLDLALGDAEIETMRRIKDALDPRRLMNPGALVED